MSYLYDFVFIFVALFALGFTIFIHELGHFLAARRRGLIVTRFSIGFGPKIFGWERNGVEYRLSAIPFGGYVALPQLADMGRLEGQQNSEDEDKAFKSWDDEKEVEPEKPLAKISYADKMIVSVMGAVFNILLAFGLACILSLFGYDVPDSQLTTKVGFVQETVERWNPYTEDMEKVTGPAKRAGMLPGDEIIAIDDAPVDNFMDIQSRIVTGKRWTKENSAKGKQRLVNVTIRRDGETINLEIFPEVMGREEIRVIGIEPKGTFFVESLEPNMPGLEAGLEVNDQPIEIDGQEIHSFSQLVSYLNDTESNQSIAFTVLKGGESGSKQTYQIIPVLKDFVTESGVISRKIIGFRPKAKIVTTYPNPFTLIIRRVNDMYLTLSGLVSPQSDVKLRNMSGPVGIVNHLSIFAKIGFKRLLWFVVFINVNLAILNLLPIPVLDGGHMLFATIEKVRGQPLPSTFLERIQTIFVLLLFSFMLYVTFFDILRLSPS